MLRVRSRGDLTTNIYVSVRKIFYLVRSLEKFFTRLTVKKSNMFSSFHSYVLCFFQYCMILFLLFTTLIIIAIVYITYCPRIAYYATLFRRVSVFEYSFLNIEVLCKKTIFLCDTLRNTIVSYINHFPFRVHKNPFMVIIHHIDFCLTVKYIVYKVLGSIF